MENQESKIDFLIEVCHKLADLLKDPTEGKEMPAEIRAQVREKTLTHLHDCIDLLGLSAHFNDGLFDIINITSKINVTKQK